MLTEPSRAELKYFVERQREEIRTINEVGRLLRTASNAEEIDRRVVSYLKQTFPLALCGILLVESRILRLFRFTRVAQADMKEAIRELCAKTGKGFSEPLKEDALTISIEDESGPGQWAEGSAGYLRSNHLSALLFNEKPLGRLAVFSVKADGFSQEDRHVIDIVADQLAAALHNAFLLEELRRIDRMKTDLLAIISHELKIPLTAIQEGTSLLVDGVVGELVGEQKDFIQTVHRNALRLQRLIEKVDLAGGILAGKISYRMEQADFLEVLKKVESGLASLAQSKGVDLSLAEKNRTMTLAGDARRLVQAVWELVENALQATPQGGSVTATLSEEANDLRLELADTGPGLSPEALSRGFGQFSMIGGINDRKTGGLGLGLFLAQKVVEAHQGRLEIQGEAGKGTRVIVRLPKEQKPAGKH